MLNGVESYVLQTLFKPKNTDSPESNFKQFKSLYLLTTYKTDVLMSLVCLNEDYVDNILVLGS